GRANKTFWITSKKPMATRTYQNEKGNPGPRLLRLRFVWLLFIYSLHAGAIWRSFNSVGSNNPSIVTFPASNVYSVQENFLSGQLISGQVISHGKRRLLMYSSVHHRAPTGKGGDGISILESP